MMCSLPALALAEPALEHPDTSPSVANTVVSIFILFIYYLSDILTG